MSEPMNGQPLPSDHEMYGNSPYYEYSTYVDDDKTVVLPPGQYVPRGGPGGSSRIPVSPPATPPAAFGQQLAMPPATPYPGQLVLPEMPLPPVTPQPPKKRQRGLFVALAIVGALLVIFAGLGGTFAILYAQRGLQGSTTVNLPSATKTAPTPAATSQTTQSSFKSAACPFTPGKGMVEGQGVRCGYLTVLEDRTRPTGSKIELAVAIFKAAGPTISPEPMVYLTGGPGGGALSSWGPYITPAYASEFTLGHDLILLDQRGTGYSKPSLTCKETEDLSRDTQDQDLSADQSNALYVQALKKCRDRWTQSGVDLNSYTTITNATDVHELIQALGYKQVHLYGVSYGTRLALTVMRLFPNDLRSVILDSTVPAQDNLFTSYPKVYQHSFDTLFKGCAADSICHQRYPNVEETFYQLIPKLNAHPVTFKDVKFGQVTLNGSGLADWVFSSLYVTSFIPELPRAITQISKGDYTIISRTYGLLLLDNDISTAMYWSVECGEDLSFTTQQELNQAAQALHPELRDNFLSGLKSDTAICQMWGQKAVPTEQKQPVTSTIPTLILSGEYDPITPTSNAELAQQTLSNSYLFVFPATGHGVFFTATCPDQIMQEFMQNPGVKPTSASCINNMQPPNFQ